MSNDLFDGWDNGFHDKHWQNMPTFDQKDKAAQRQIIISFDNDDDVRAFAKLIDQSITDKTKSLWFPYREKNKVSDLFWIDNGEEK